MNNYTVLLLRPDYIADEFGKDTYLAHVVANGAAEAAQAAQREARDADFASDGGDWVDHTDYHVLLVCVGHLKDLKP
jgi:hypothetical protein